MPTFPGSLRLASDPESRVRAQIEVDDERLVVRTGEEELGNWELAALDFDPTPGGFRMNADGEELILTTGDNPAFADLVGVTPPPKLGSNGSEAAEQAVPAKGADSSRFGSLRSRSAATWVSEDTMHPLLSYAVFAAGIVVIVGAVLNWGDARLLGGDGIPWARIFAGAAAIGAMVGAYIAWREERRTFGAGIAVGSGALILILLFFYARAAGLGLGFFVAMIAVVPLTAAAVVGLTKWGVAPEPDRG